MIWARPNENRMVIRTSRTQYFSLDKPLISEGAFIAEWETRMQMRGSGLITSLSMAEDNRLVVYRGSINESMHRVIPKKVGS